jgi:hypothetical protein
VTRRFEFSATVEVRFPVSTSIVWIDEDIPDAKTAEIYLGDEIRQHLSQRLARFAVIDPKSIEIRERFNDIIHKKAEQ